MEWANEAQGAGLRISISGEPRRQEEDGLTRMGRFYAEELIGNILPARRLDEPINVFRCVLRPDFKHISGLVADDQGVRSKIIPRGSRMAALTGEIQVRHLPA